MIESIAAALKEVGKEAITKAKDLPAFAKKLEKPKLSIKEADKPFKKIKTINEELEGKLHPETGVPFKRKIIEVR